VVLQTLFIMQSSATSSTCSFSGPAIFRLMFLNGLIYILQEPHNILFHNMDDMLRSITPMTATQIPVTFVRLEFKAYIHYSHVPLLLSTAQFLKRCVVLPSQGYKSKQQYYGVLKTFSCPTVKKHWRQFCWRAKLYSAQKSNRVGANNSVAVIHSHAFWWLVHLVWIGESIYWIFTSRNCN
jgi:hypothetical protein